MSASHHTSDSKVAGNRSSFKMDIKKFFLKEKNRYIRKFGRKPLSNFELDQECDKLFGSRYKGTFMQDSLKTYKPGYYIVNTDFEGNGGIHWVAVSVTPKSAYIFDSFGRDTDSLLPILKKNLSKQGLKIVESDQDQDQKGDSAVCGVLCICWLLCCKQFGVVKTAKAI